MERDPEHWLLRLTAAEWLAAARNELARARRALEAASQRKGLVEARRAAGMALNAWLRVRPSEAYGRSYMEHLVALAEDAAAPADAKNAALRLIEKPATGAEPLVGLRGLVSAADLEPVDAASAILAFASRAVDEVERPS